MNPSTKITPLKILSLLFIILLWFLIIFCLKQRADTIPIINSESNSTSVQSLSTDLKQIEKVSTSSASTIKVESSTSKPKKIDLISYMGRKLTDVAKEFNVKYDLDDGWSFDVLEDGRIISFEQDVGLYPSPDRDRVFAITVVLKEMGKCKRSEVYTRIDEALNIVGIDPKIKGYKNPGIKGELLGDGSYKGFNGNPEDEVFLRCWDDDPDDDDYSDWRLIIFDRLN